MGTLRVKPPNSKVNSGNSSEGRSPAMTFPALSLDFFLPLQVSPLAMERGWRDSKSNSVWIYLGLRVSYCALFVLFLISALSAPDLTCPVI